MRWIYKKQLKMLQLQYAHFHILKNQRFYDAL